MTDLANLADRMNDPRRQAALTIAEHKGNTGNRLAQQ